MTASSTGAAANSGIATHAATHSKKARMGSVFAQVKRFTHFARNGPSGGWTSGIADAPTSPNAEQLTRDLMIQRD